MKPLLRVICLFWVLCLHSAAFPLFGQRQQLDSLLTELQNHPQADTIRVKLLHNIGLQYDHVDYDSMYYYARKALVLARKLKWERSYGTIYNNLGLVSDARGKPEEALKYYQFYYDHGVRRKDTGQVILSLINIASVHQNTFRDTTAIQYYHRAQRLAEAKADHHALSLIHNNIANIYFMLGNYPKALDYIAKATDASKMSPNQADYANALETRGNIEMVQGKPDTARLSYQKALNQYREIGQRLNEAALLSRIALTFADLDTKLGYHLRAQQVFDEQLPRHPDAVTNIGNIGGTYARIAIHAWDTLDRQKTYENFPLNKTKLLALATQYLLRAIDLSRETGDKDNEAEFINYLAQVQQFQGNYKAALENLVLSIDLEDSLHSQENKNRIAELQAGFAFEKKEADLKLRQQAAEHRQKEFILYGILAAVVILSLTGYLLYRSRLRGVRLRNEMREKEFSQQAEALLLQQQLSESELKAIRSQMNPHFIFNVLNSIESYILDNEPREASKLVQQLARLSRLVLENSTQSLVTADREWAAVQLYVELEASRFNHSFDQHYVVDPVLDLSSVMLPPMLIQPLVENAILHGLRPIKGYRGSLTLTIVKESSWLVITVTDNGVGRKHASKWNQSVAYKEKSMGIASIHERLEMLKTSYPSREATLSYTDLDPVKHTGTIACLTLPLITTDQIVSVT